MNDDLPAPIPAPVGPGVLYEEDLRSFMRGVAPDWYRTSDLYPRYLAWANREGKTPATVKAVGEAINRYFHPQRRAAHGHVSVWAITAEMVGDPLPVPTRRA